MPDTAARPSWDEYFLRIAAVVATRATCPRLHVGCVAIRDHRILVTAYNGSPSGAEHCDEVGCLIIDGHCERTTHAETNALIQSSRHGLSLAGATIYLTHPPCAACAKLLVSAGIVRIVYRNPHQGAGTTNPIVAWWIREHRVALDYLPANTDE